MARRGKRTKGRKKRPSKKQYKKTYKVSKGKLVDKKINTAIERRIQEIALDEDLKNTIVFVRRRTLWGAYDGATNLWSAGSAFSFSGVAWRGITVLPKLNMDFQQPNPQAATVNDPVTQENEPAEAAANASAGPLNASIIGGDGFRRGSKIMIHGFKLQVRLVLFPAITDSVGEEGDCTVQYAIIRTNHVRTYSAAGLDPLPMLSAKELLRTPSWNYDPRLDTRERGQATKYSKRVVCSGKIHMVQPRQSPAVRFPGDAELEMHQVPGTPISYEGSFSHDTTNNSQNNGIHFYSKPNIKYGTASVRFKRGQLFEYLPDDQMGTEPQFHQYWVCLRSTTADAGMTKPTVIASCKMYYSDV